MEMVLICFVCVWVRVCVHFERKFAIFKVFFFSLSVFFFICFQLSPQHCTMNVICWKTSYKFTFLAKIVVVVSLSRLLIFLFFSNRFFVSGWWVFTFLWQFPNRTYIDGMFARTTEHVVAKWIVHAIWCDFLFLRNFSSNFLLVGFHVSWMW